MFNKVFIVIKTICIFDLEHSVTIFKSSSLDNLYNLYQFGYNRTNVKSVFFKKSSTFDWMTEMFTGWKLSSYYFKYNVSQEDATMLYDLNLNAVESIMNTNWDNFKDKQIHPFLKEIVNRLIRFEGGLVARFNGRIPGNTLNFTEGILLTVGNIEDMFNFNLNSLIYTTSFKVLNQSSRDYLENVLFKNLSSVVIKDLHYLLPSLPPQQLYLLSFKSIIYGHVKFYNDTQLYDKVISEINVFRDNPLTLVIIAFGRSRNLFLNNNFMYLYQQIFGITENQYMDLTKYTENDTKLFNKATYNDYKIITGNSPFDGNITTLEKTLAKQGGIGDVLVTKLEEYALIHDNSTIQNLSIMQILSNSTDIASVYGLIAKEALIQKVLSILFEQQQEQTFRNIIYNMSLGSLADVVFNTTTGDMMKGKLLYHFTRIKHCK